MIRTLSMMIATLAFAGSAFAGTAFTVTLDAPKENVQKIVAAKALWSCQDSTCQATLDRKRVKVSTCKQVVQKVGKVSAFGNEVEALSDSDLERCNAIAKS